MLYQHMHLPWKVHRASQTQSISSMVHRLESCYSRAYVCFTLFSKQLVCPLLILLLKLSLKGIEIKVSI